MPTNVIFRYIYTNWFGFFARYSEIVTTTEAVPNDSHGTPAAEHVEAIPIYPIALAQQPRPAVFRFVSCTFLTCVCVDKNKCAANGKNEYALVFFFLLFSFPFF